MAHRLHWGSTQRRFPCPSHYHLDHTDTLYAVYLPNERLLWTADFALVRTILPIGGPDYYFPGAVKAMERLAALDFDTFVPSHSGYGKSKTSSTTSAS